MPDAPTRFERVANWFDGPRKVLVAAGAGAVVIIAAAAIVRELAMGGLAIDPVVVKATNTPDAPTPELAAQQIARAARSDPAIGRQEWRWLHVDDGVHPVDLQIPGAPPQPRSAAREVVALFGLAPVTVRSALTRRNDGRAGTSAVMSLAGRSRRDGQLPGRWHRGHARQHLRCIAFNAIAFVDPKTAASYILKREQAECKGLDSGLAPAMPDLHREEHRINNRREHCSFRADPEAHRQDDEQHRQGGAALGALHLRPDPHGPRQGAGRCRPSAAALELDQAIGRFRGSAAPDAGIRPRPSRC